MFYFTQFKTSKFDIAVLCLPNCRQKVAVNTAWAHPRVYSEDHFRPGSMLMLITVVIVAVMFLALIVLVDSAYLFLCEHSREETPIDAKRVPVHQIEKKNCKNLLFLFFG